VIESDFFMIVLKSRNHDRKTNNEVRKIQNTMKIT